MLFLFFLLYILALPVTVYSWFKFNIGVIDEFTPGHAFLRVELQATVEEVQTLQRNEQFLGELVVALLQVATEVFLIATGEGHETRDHLEENYTQRPHICFVVVFLTIEYFRSHDNRCTAVRLTNILILQFPSEAQVRNFDLKWHLRQVYVLQPGVLHYLAVDRVQR